MFKFVRILVLSFTASLAISASASGLVSAEWLKSKLGSGDLLVIDTMPGKMHAAGHIPGAVNVDLYGSGMVFMPASKLEPLFQSWGIDPAKKIVIYDQGAYNMATWLFWELYHQGFPEENLAILDGGLAKWQETGGAVTKDPTPAPAKGAFRIAKTRDDARVRLPEFLVASGDSAGNAIVEALEPNYHFGDNKFFSIAGHIPKAVMWPNADFYNTDKTFKSPEEIRRMAAYLGIKPEQQVNSYCGGGVAATVPFFALRFVAGYPKVKVYKESMFEWLRDERELPVWTYDAPYLRRDPTWLNGWNNRMLRAFGVSGVSIVDVRSADAYKQAHIPYALNIPTDVFKSNLGDPAKLATILGPGGVDPASEAVIVSDGGLNPASALAFLALEQAGQKKISLLMESVDDWGLAGLELAKDATIVGMPKSPQDMAVPPANYASKARPGIVIGDTRGAAGLYPKVLIASGKAMPAKAPEGKVIHVPYTDLLNANGKPKSAAEIWKVLTKAGVPRYAEIICFSDDPGEAAANYYVLKLMGYPDVKVLVSGRAA